MGPYPFCQAILKDKSKDLEGRAVFKVVLKAFLKALLGVPLLFLGLFKGEKVGKMRRAVSKVVLKAFLRPFFPFKGFACSLECF